MSLLFHSYRCTSTLFVMLATLQAVAHTSGAAEPAPQQLKTIKVEGDQAPDGVHVCPFAVLRHYSCRLP